MGTLGYAILGLLAGGPRTGYDIARAMQRPLGYFWSARHSQIYPQLAQLESAGWTRSRVIPGPGPRDTKRYTLTPTGRSALVSWLATPGAAEPVKSELLLRVWSLWLLSPDQARALIGTVRTETLEALAQLDLEEQGFSIGVEDTDLTDPEFGRWATLQYGVGQRRAVLDWCDWLLRRLADPGGR